MSKEFGSSFSFDRTVDIWRTTFPNKYESTAFYGVNVKKVPSENDSSDYTYAVIWESESQSWRQGLKTKVDIWGDSLLRRTDYHVPHQPLKTLLKHPRQMAEMTVAPPLFQRGRVGDTWQRIQSLQLEKYYQLTSKMEK